MMWARGLTRSTKKRGVFMRIPQRIVEHPVETAIACLLLLGLLFSSADFTPSANAWHPASPPTGTGQKL
jgi:hypothetical protein